MSEPPGNTLAPSLSQALALHTSALSVVTLTLSPSSHPYSPLSILSLLRHLSLPLSLRWQVVRMVRPESVTRSAMTGGKRDSTTGTSPELPLIRGTIIFNNATHIHAHTNTYTHKYSSHTHIHTRHAHFTHPVESFMVRKKRKMNAAYHSSTQP